MRRAERIASVERKILAAAAKVRAQGGTIICDGFQATGPGDQWGVCALGAADHCKVQNLGLASSRITVEWDSTEYGFDGVPLGRVRAIGAVDPDFWRLGQRLRRALAPIPASLFEATSAPRVPRVRFTGGAS